MVVKHVLLLIGLSVAAVLFQNQLMQGLKFFLLVHTQIANGLGVIFSVDSVGEMVQSVLALLLIPVVVGILLAFVHFFVKQHHFPHTMTVIWVCWAVLLASVLSQTGHVTNQVAEVRQPAPIASAPQLAQKDGKPGVPGQPAAQPGQPAMPSQGQPAAPIPDQHKA